MSIINPGDDGSFSDIQKLRAINEPGSTAGGSDQLRFKDDIGPIQAEHLLSKSKLNWWQWVIQRLFIGEVETEVVQHQVGQQRKRHIHGEEQLTDAIRQENEVGTVIKNRRSRLNGEKQVRASECETFLHTMDAVVWCSKYHADRKQLVEVLIKDPKSRSQTNDAIDMVLKMCLSRITMTVVGPIVNTDIPGSEGGAS